MMNRDWFMDYAEHAVRVISSETRWLEMRGWITKNGRHILIGEEGSSGGKAAKRVDKAGESDIIGLKTPNGIKISSLSEHATQRLNEPERRSTVEGIRDAILHPIHIGDVDLDSFGRKSQRFIGRYATININPDTGIITTVWKTGKRYLKKYMKE